MSKLITGRVEKVLVRDRTWPDGEKFKETTLAVADWGSTEYVQLGRSFPADQVPAEGDEIALDVYARTYVNKDGKAGCAFNSTGRNAEVEAKLFGPLTTKLAAAAS